MAASVRTVTKALAAEEDLLLGEGTAQQTRAGVPYTVSKIRGFRPVNDMDELNALDFNKFPKAVLVTSGYLKFFQFNGVAYEQVIPVTKTKVTTSGVTSISAVSVNTQIISSAAPHTLDTITNGTTGQELNIIDTTGNTTIENNAGIVLKGGSNYDIPANTGIRLVYTGTVWAEV